MNIFRKIKNFIRRIFVDYGAIDRMIEEKSRSSSENIISNNTQKLDQVVSQLTSEFNEKISSITSRVDSCSEKIDNIKVDNTRIENQIQNVQTNIDQYKYFNPEINEINENNSKVNILLIGFYGAPNLGDELMLETLVEYLENVKNKSITVMLADNSNYNIDKLKDVKIIHYPINLCDFNTLAEKYDYIIFGGGAIIDDSKYTVVNSHRYDLGTIFIKLSMRAIAFKKKVISIGLSTSEQLTNTEYKEKLKYIIENSEFFSVRDSYSKQYLEEILDNRLNDKIVLVDDIVFSNVKVPPCVQRKQELDNSKVRCGIVYISNDNNKEKLKAIINAIHEKYDSAIINLIPFYEYNQCDTNFYKDVINELNDSSIECNVMRYPVDMEEVINLYKENDIMVCMRYHAILLAYLLNIPCIPICYDIHPQYKYKIKYINEFFNKHCDLKYSSMSKESIINNMDYLLKNDDDNYDFCTKTALNAQKNIEEIIERHIT